MATLAVGGTTVFDGATLQSGAVLTSATFPAGHVLQVVSYYTTAQGTVVYSSVDQVVNGMTMDITPKGADSDFLVAVRIGGEGPYQWNKVFNIQMDGTRVNPAANSGSVGLHQNGLGVMTEGHEGENSDSTPEFLAFSTLVKNTSSVIGTDITFRLVTSGADTTTSYFNRCVAVNNEEFSSELIITEIKG